MADITPAQREAEGTDTIEIEWRGETFTLPASWEQWDLDTIEAFEAGKVVTAVKLLLGPSQYRRFKKLGDKGADLGQFMEHAAEIVGFESAGN